MSKFVLRGNPPSPELPFAVVELDANGYGREIAHFCNEGEAKQYAAFREHGAHIRPEDWQAVNEWLAKKAVENPR